MAKRPVVSSNETQIKQINDQSSDQLKKSLENVLKENQVILRSVFIETQETLNRIARALSAVNIIGRAVRIEPTYESIIRSFINGTKLKDDVSDIQEHCVKFLTALASVGGPVADASDMIKKKWIKAVREMGLNITFEVGAEVSFASPPSSSPTKRHTVQLTELNINHLVKIRDLLKKHGYSGVDYYDLGLRLGLLPRTLNAIKKDNRGDVRSCLRDCLVAWLEQKDNVDSKGGPTYESLIQALRDEEENAVADGIEREIPSSMVQPNDNSASIPIDKPEDTPATDRIQDIQNPLIQNLLDKKPQANDLHRLFKGSAAHYLTIGTALDVQVIDLLHSPMSPSDKLILVFQRWIDSDNDVTWRNILQIYEDYPEELGSAKAKVEAFLSSNRAHRKYGTDTTGITEADDFDREKIEKWLKEGEVELKVTRINMHGAPGAGKTCSQHLLLNEPPPSSTDSTPIACPAVQATRIAIDDENKKWQRVELEDLLKQLASTEVDKPKPEDDVHVPAHSDEPSLEEPLKNEPTKDEPTETQSSENEQAANKATEKKSTEKKPAKNKPTNTELVEQMLQASKEGKSKKLSRNWVYFIDSGGQPAYRELLPLFTRAAALNIITIDLTKGLDEKCKFQYRISQHKSPIDTDLKYPNRDIIRSIISSEAMLNSIEIPYVFKSHMPSHPHYLILGTRKELVTQEKLKEMNESLMNSSNLDLTNVIQHAPRKSIIFPVNTLLPAGSKEREEASVALCNAISNCRVEMTIKLPIRLLAFEIELQLEAKKKNRSFLTREEVSKIGNQFLLDDESDMYDESNIDDALQYLHNVTIILYYRDVLPNLVFVDPKPILDVLSRLIAITYVNQSNLHLLADPPPSPDERDNLMKFGLFKENLLTIIGKEIFNDDFQPSHMIKLLKHLHIIAKVENREEGDYFFPCALPSYDKLNPAPTEIQPLLIAWEINNSGTKTLAIPQGLFPLTIVHLLEQKDKVDFCPDDKEFYRYHDAMSLRVNEEYTIDIINRYTHIEIRFYDCKEFCPQIRELVTEAIKKSNKVLKVCKNHIFAFKCPPLKSEQCYCIVKEDKSSTRCIRCRSQCKVLQGGDDSYRCWFSDQLLSPVIHSEKDQNYNYELQRKMKELKDKEYENQKLLQNKEKELTERDQILEKHLTEDELKGVHVAEKNLFLIHGGSTQSVIWKEYGIRITIPQGAVLASDTVQVTITALVGGDFIFPEDTELVSAVYAINLSKPFLEPVKLEIQHCVSIETASHCNHLSFATAPSDEAPYQFKPVNGGNFVPNGGYGSIYVSDFCLWGLIEYVRTSISHLTNKSYCGQVIREVKRPGREWLMKFLLCKDLNALKEHINKEFKNNETISVLYFSFEEENDFIEFCFNKQCPEGWSLIPYDTPTRVSQREIDDFGSMSPPNFPQRLIEITAEPDEGADKLNYPVGLKGIKCETKEINIVLTTVIQQSLALSSRDEVNSASASQTQILNINDLVEIIDLLKKHRYSGVDYYDLGLHLGLFPSTLNIIDNERGDISSHLRLCLEKWLQQADDVKSKGGPTYDTLVQALRKIEKNAVADGIEGETRE